MRHPFILMAAGLASRMKKALSQEIGPIDPLLIEEANTLPKCMLSVGPKGTRFIDYILWNAIQSGFEEIIVLLHPLDNKTEIHVREIFPILCLGNGSVTLSIARQQVPPDREKPWGTGDAVFQALQQYPLEDGDLYTISNADNLCSQEVFTAARRAKTNTLLSYDTLSLGISPQARTSYGLIVSDRTTGAVLSVVEKPSLDELKELDSKANLSVNMNIVTLGYGDTIEKLSNLVPSVRNEKEITDVYYDLIQKGKLNSVIIRESLPDLTSKADIPVVQQFLQHHYQELVWKLKP